MKCENCGAEAFCTVVATDGHEVMAVHLCEEHAAVAGMAAMMVGALVVGVFKPGKEPGDATGPTPLPA